ncbi:MAG: amidohydrolase family protein [Myxococcota bacterium]
MRAAARVAIGEALLAGTTTLVDHHESPSIIAGSLDVLAEAALSLGIRAVLAYGASERNGGADEAAAGLAECERFARVVGLRHPTLRAMVGLHAGFTVSDPTIARAVALGRELGVPLHVHVAEDEADVADARRRGYAGALARLVAHGAVGPGAVLAHGIHLGRDEVAWVAGSGAFFAQNPRSNRTNGVGYPSVLAGARVALGTDGYPSRMEDEVRVAQDDGARHGEPMTLADERLRAGWELAAWHFADDPPGSSDVCAMGPDGAVHVVVAGRVVVRDGRLVGADIAELRRDASEAAARLATRMQATRENPSGEPPAPAGERAAPALAGVLRRPADGIHNPG